MRRGWRGIPAILAVSLAVILVSGPGSPEESDESENGHLNDLNRLSFLAGSWVSENGPRRLEEHWTVPAGGTMIGMNRTVAGERTASYEYLRIEQTGEGIDYVALPVGQQLTRFRLIECGDHRAVFENPRHDFPNRIIYQRRGDKLTGRIEGTRGGHEASAQWEWTRGTLAGP